MRKPKFQYLSISAKESISSYPNTQTTFQANQNCSQTTLERLPSPTIQSPTYNHASAQQYTSPTIPTENLNHILMAYHSPATNKRTS